MPKIKPREPVVPHGNPSEPVSALKRSIGNLRIVERFTQDFIRNQTQTVFRRLEQWGNGVVGDIMEVVGREIPSHEKGSRQHLAWIEIVETRMERLNEIQRVDVDAEGWPNLTLDEYRAWFLSKKKWRRPPPVDLWTKLIRFKYISDKQVRRDFRTQQLAYGGQPTFTATLYEATLYYGQVLLAQRYFSNPPDARQWLQETAPQWLAHYRATLRASIDTCVTVQPAIHDKGYLVSLLNREGWLKRRTNYGYYHLHYHAPKG